MAQKHRTDIIEWKRVLNLGNLLLIITGVALAVLAMKGFMIPNHFIDGGVTGVSILLHAMLDLNISLLTVCINLVFIYLGYKRIGKTFAVQTAIAVALLSIGLLFVTIKPITSDRLLIAIFGGILIGSGMGLVIRGGRRNRWC